jgi:hypothetical protein
MSARHDDLRDCRSLRAPEEFVGKLHDDPPRPTLLVNTVLSRRN